DLLLPHERRVRESRSDRGARPAHRRDRSDGCHDRTSRPLGTQGQRSTARPARVLTRSGAAGPAPARGPRAVSPAARILSRALHVSSARSTLAPAHTRLMYRAVHADRAGRVIVSDYAAAAFDGAATVPFADALPLPSGATVLHVEREAETLDKSGR